MSQFELPANIKQIGSIGEGLRIYVEDYVCSYLYQYADSGGYEERIALLVGRYIVIDNAPILFISGAIQGKYCEIKNGLTVFTERSMEYAQACVNKYFRDMEIVGWMQSQPSYGVFLNSGYAGYHIDNFQKDHHVLFVMDPIENINAFYTYGKDCAALEEAKGYFIYYDKNRNMHEYMLENKITEVRYRPQPEPVREVRPDSPHMRHTLPAGRERLSDPEYIIKNRQTQRTFQKNAQEQKRILNLLVSLSAVLFIVCFIMGAGLIQNQDRIYKLELQIVQLSTSYKNMAIQTNKDGTASVFAAQQEAAQTPAPDEAFLIREDGNENLLAANTEAAATASPAPTETPEAAAVSVPAPRPIPATYTVEVGDSLISISLKFYGTKAMVQNIMDVNGIEDADKILSGETIKLPAQ